MKRLPVLLALAAGLPGCYSTVDLLGGDADTATDAPGDTSTDTAIDPWSDPWIDPWTDTWTDPWVDPWVDPWTDPWVDPDDPPWTCPYPDPYPSGPQISFFVDGAGMPEPTELEAECRVSSVSTDSTGGTYIRLSCMSPDGTTTTHTVEVASDPMTWIPVWEGQGLRLTYIADPVWWVNRWLVLRDEWGNLVLGITDADSIAPWETDPWTWYSPLGVDVLGGLCPLEESGCGLFERLGIQATAWDASTIVYDGTYSYVGWMGGYMVIVMQSRRYAEMWCDDVPMEFHSVMFVQMLEG